MKKRIFLAMAAGLVAQATYAETDTELADNYFNKTNPVLTAQEKAALNISRKWSNDSANGIKPVAGPNGTVTFVYGGTEPSIVCAVMQVCDVALQPGEQVSSVNLGDSVRWLVEPAVSGAGANAIQHLIIKPLDVGLETSLVVTTDRRTYHMRLRSHRTEYMASVAFSYPEVAAAQWAALQRAQATERKVNTLPTTGEYLGDLDFNYKLRGAAPWKPVRVYNDGTKTIIEMPKAMSQTEAPTLLAIRDSGSAFKKDEQVMVNYRLQGSRYIVDTVIDKAVLIAGVGSSQQKVMIERSKK
ncbi:P-type conjugative transfer protein TrbG [Dyella flava]|uniref:P-type conjugative transfer protein TrbG n=1 Tax=Dyella flava TaxID=1920170 RepID=A0ABS2K8L3_9GAMM|nr:P-type conjugative transfer protein TrbG [Dyella flava]MBM7127567.1 P-type conjugative transfer protein TrbG [Dyella flava]GLQ51165.1 putative conjugal transfer protein TrbG [Dyella flava]